MPNMTETGKSKSICLTSFDEYSFLSNKLSNIDDQCSSDSVLIWITSLPFVLVLGEGVTIVSVVVVAI